MLRGWGGVAGDHWWTGTRGPSGAASSQPCRLVCHRNRALFDPPFRMLRGAVRWKVFGPGGPQPRPWAVLQTYVVAPAPDPRRQTSDYFALPVGSRDTYSCYDLVETV